MTKFIDAETLISLVEVRPAIWDKTFEGYKDKSLRMSAWKEISRILNKKFEVMGDRDKDMYVKTVIKKWNHIRDSWLRSINTLKKARLSASGHVKKYRYNHKMLFLKKILELPPTQRTYDFDNDNSYNNEIIVNVPPYENSPITNQNEEIVQEPSNPVINEIPIVNEIPRHETPVVPAKRYKKKDVTKKPNTICNKMMTFIEDRHMSFFKSLIPSLALLDDDQTLLFQSGVINLLQTIKRHNSEWEQQPSTSNYSFQSSQGLIPPQYHVQPSPSSSNQSPEHTEDMQSSPTENSASNLSDNHTKTQQSSQKSGNSETTVFEDILKLVKIEMKE